jgi:alpha-2-macroglobulin
VRKLAALEALSRYSKAQGRITGSITVAPNQWPTSAVIDWLNILKRVADMPQREQRLAEASQILKSRLSFQGTKLIFSTEKDDYWWWLMTNGDVNTARLMLAVMDDTAWAGDMGRLANGFIGRQQKGAWHTTTANLWGGLALKKFSAKFEAKPVAGVTKATLAAAAAGTANVAGTIWSASRPPTPKAQSTRRRFSAPLQRRAI